jgi:hypothetical protein
MTVDWPGKPQAITNVYAENNFVCSFFLQRFNGTSFYSTFEPFTFMIW